MKKIDFILNDKDMSRDIFFRYGLFQLNKYSLLKNQHYVRSCNRCLKTSVANVRKTITALIFYILLKNLARVGSLDRISGIETIVLRLNLSISSIFLNASLQLMENSMVISVRVCNGSSTILLSNHLDSNVYQMITCSDNYAINPTGFMSLI